MQILKFGEVLKYFDINDFAYGAAKELSNLYEDYDITTSIFNGILYNNGNKLTLDVNSDTGDISTTKNLNYVQVLLNKDISVSSILEKKIYFKCRFTTPDFIENQYIFIVGDYNHVSWVLVEINNGKFEFYDNDSTDITTNVLVKTLDIPQNVWIDFEIHAKYSADEGFFRYDIKVNDEVIQNITGHKKTSDVYNNLCFDDGFVLYNIFKNNTNYVLYKDIVLQRQMMKFIKKPEIVISRETDGNHVILTPKITIDSHLQPIYGYSDEYTFAWEDGSTNLQRTVDLATVHEYKVCRLSVTDSLGQTSTSCVMVENFSSYTNSIVKYGWSTTGEMTKTISFEDDIKGYKNFNYIAQDIYGTVYYGSCLVDNFEKEDETYEIVSYEWNTGEVSRSIYVNPDEKEYGEYYCTVTDNFGNKVTDSIIVDNFIAPYNEIVSYNWSNAKLEQSITVEKQNECDVYWCIATDLWGNTVKGYITVENFKDVPDNRIVSYKWNTLQISSSIEVPYPDEQYKTYYCTVTDFYGNTTTDSTVVTKFKEPPETNKIESYTWSNGSTEQEISVSLDSFNTQYKIVTCTAEDSYGVSVESSYIVEKPVVYNSECEVVSYKWNNGETTQSIDVNTAEIEDFEIYSCTITDNYSRTTTDSVILSNFKQPYNEISSYKWNTGDTAQSITVDLNSIGNYEIYACTMKDIYGRNVTDSIIINTLKDIYNNIKSYKWNTGDTTQSITVNLDNVDEYTGYSCTVTDEYNKNVTDSIIVENFKNIHNSIDTYLWNTGDTTQSITVNLDNVDEYAGYSCTVTDEYNKNVTDSIIVENFKSINNSIDTYLWNTGETTQSIIVDLNAVDEMEEYYCTVTDRYSRNVTDSIIVDNFMNIENTIVSYEWYTGDTTQSITVNKDYIYDFMSCWCTVTDSFNRTVTDNIILTEEVNISPDLTYEWSTGETTQSITVPKTENEFEVYYCSATNLYNQCTTDSIVVDNFKNINNDVVSYLWSTGETTQSIEVDLENYAVPTIFSCTVTDELGVEATGFEILSNGEPVLTYEWSHGATSKIVSLRKNGIYTVTVTSESGHQESASIELEGLGDRPSVEIVCSPACIEEGENLTLTALGTDLDGTIVKYKWFKVNDDGTRTLIEEYSDSTQSITINNVTKSDVYLVQVEDDDGYIAESLLNVEFIEFTDVLFYKYNGKTFIVPLHAVITENSINIYKNNRNLYARYVEIDDIQASHLHVKINDEIKKLMKL